VQVRVFHRVCAALIAFDVAISIVALVRIADRTDAAERATPPPRATPAAQPAARPSLSAQAAAWVVRELPSSEPVLADAAVSRVLARHGFHPVGTDAIAAFVVSTPALRAAALNFPALARTLDSSVPVAVLGSGADEVVVRQVAAVTPAQMAADARARRSAENELLTNPSFSAGAQAAVLMRAGELDWRCATFLAITASTDRVRLLRVNVDAAEQAAGLPARSIDVRTTSDDRLRAFIRDASVDYRLASARHLADGSWQLSWPVDATPTS
jgi:hypothetical protein